MKVERGSFSTLKFLVYIFWIKTKIHFYFFFPFQEYPPGVIVIPMESRTLKPFCTTNLVVFAPEHVPSYSGDKNCIACGDALIVDPGCLSKFHEEVKS